MGTRLRGSRRKGVAARVLPNVGIPTACALLAVCVLFGYASRVIAQEAELTAVQAARASHIERMLVAVCCFRQVLAEHQSERAEAMRDELRSKVAAGATDDEIISYFVSKYGERVLVAPEARGFNVLAYLMPAVAVVAGLFAILLFARRARRAEPAVVAPARAESPVVADLDPDLKAQMAEELDQFDE